MTSLSTGTMAPFDVLPTDIVLIIMEQISDFVSLDNLIQTSPRAAAIFTRWAIPLTQRVLLSCPMTLQVGQFQEVLTIHSPFARYANLSEFKARFWTENARSIDLVQYFADQDPSEVAAVLRDMVHVAAHIQRIACACLSKMMANLYAVVSSNPIFPSSREIAGTMKPSWVEEYRVYRALWHMQVYSDLVKASGPNEVRRSSSPLRWGGWNWPSNNTNPSDGWYPTERNVSGHVQYEILQISRFLQIMTGTKKSNVRSAVVKIPLRTHLFDGPVWCPPPLPRDTKAARTWDQSLDSVTRQAASMPSFALLRSFDRPLGWIAPEVIPELSLYLHDLGLFLWDRLRACCVGIVFTQAHERAMAPADYGVVRDPETYFVSGSEAIAK